MTAKIELVEVPDESVTIDGRSATPDAVQEVLDRFETRKRNLIPGGKSLDGARGHSPTVQIRVPTAMHTEMVERARKEGITVSRMAREAIDRYLNAG